MILIINVLRQIELGMSKRGQIPPLPRNNNTGHRQQFISIQVTGYVTKKQGLLCVNCDLEANYDTPLGHEQKLCEILPRSDMVVKSYGPVADFRYMHTVTLALIQDHDTPLDHG